LPVAGILPWVNLDDDADSTESSKGVTYEG
jgi:hypothetical protein